MKGQAALAYLVMVAAILTIAVTSVIIFQSMLSPAEAANIVIDDKYSASLVGVQFVDYEKPYTGALYAPSTAIYESESYNVVPYDVHPKNHPNMIVEIGNHRYVGKFKVSVDPETSNVMWLQSFRSRVCEIWVEKDEVIGEAVIDDYCANHAWDSITVDSSESDIGDAATVAYNTTPGLGGSQIAN